VIVRGDGQGGEYGIMTKRDVIKKVVVPNHDPARLKVADVMSRPLLTVPPDCSLRDCSRKMIEHNVRRMPVAGDGQIVGIVSDTDIFMAVEERGWEPE
jgi:isocitrate dehydrogenase